MLRMKKWLHNAKWACVLCLLGCLIGKSDGEGAPLKPLTLSLDEAILLAVRQNPNVVQSQLSHLQAKFALDVAQWQFQPHFALSASRTATRTVTEGFEETTNATTMQPSATWNTPIGTQFTLTSINNITGHYNPALQLQVVQPLIRGFGKAVVEAALYDAIDSEHISRLTVEGQLRETITQVINAYLDLISATHTVEIDREALARAKQSVKQTEIFIKAGKKAGVELVNFEADVASKESRLEDDQNNLKQSEYAFLAAIGLDPNTPVQFVDLDIVKLIHQYKVPMREAVETLVLENDINYQIEQITLEGATKRAVVVANDNTRWQLDLSVNGTMGNGSGGGPNAGTNSIFNGYNQSQSAALNLTIPIDDRAAKEALATAKISLREAEINLKKDRWEKQTNAINAWNSIVSNERALALADQAKVLENKNYAISFKKYSYGLIDGLELQTAQQNLVQSERTLVDRRLAYLKALAYLDALIGNTLNTWHIQMTLGEMNDVS